MIHKTYRTRTIAEAVDQIKRELGPRAQIVGIRRKAQRSILPWQKTVVIEADASVEERYVTPDQIEILQKTSGVRFTKDDDEKDGVKPLQVNAFQRAEISSYENRIKQMQGLIDDLQKQISSMQLSQDEIAFVQHSLDLVPQSKPRTDDSLMEMAAHLARKGITEDVQKLWMQFMNEKDVGIGADAVFDHTAEWVLGLIPVYAQGDIPKTVLVHGESGSGCTTTTIRLAQCCQDNGCTPVIVVIGEPTYREKRLIRSHVARLKIRGHIISRPEELADIVAATKDNEKILVDIGSDEQKISQVIAVLESVGCENASLWQVISATNLDKWNVSRDAEALVISHLDQCPLPGKLISKLSQSQKPAAYFGTGRRCESDMESASAERLAALLFELDEEDEKSAQGASEAQVLFQ